MSPQAVRSMIKMATETQEFDSSGRALRYADVYIESAISSVNEIKPPYGGDSLTILGEILCDLHSAKRLLKKVAGEQDVAASGTVDM